MQIQILDQKDKQKTRALYENCFPEDSTAFVDFYYEEKCRDNQIYAGIEGDKIQTMVHLNPFRIQLFSLEVEAHYIVAVATDPTCRGQGKMNQLMRAAMRDMKEQGESFTFLMPADEAYYRSLGFRFFTNCMGTRGSDDLLQQKNLISLTDELAEGATQYANQVLEKRYDLYVKRDKAYYIRQIKEQKCENGDVFVQSSKENTNIPIMGNDITGIFCYSNEENVEIREYLSDHVNGKAVSPMYMGRILDPIQFVRSLCSQQQMKKRFYLQDDVLPENEGFYDLEIDARGGRIHKWSKDEAEMIGLGYVGGTKEAFPLMTIANLGEELFPLIRVFINEEV